VYISQVIIRRIALLRMCVSLAVVLSALLIVGCDNGPFSTQTAEVPDPVAVNPNDPLFTDGDNYQWYLDTINAPGAWALYEATAGVSYAGRDLQQVIVSVIDAGIVAGHEDLSSVLSTDGFYFVNGNTMPIPEGLPPSMVGDAHGTHVSGLIAARGANGRGIAGATYNGWPGPMFLVRPVIALDANGDGFVSDIAVAIMYSAGLENGSDITPPRRAEVINMSLGGEVLSASEALLLQNAVDSASSADVVIVAASGNGIDPDGKGPLAPIGKNNGVDYPARFSNVIAVGSIDQDFGRSEFSDFGSDLEIVAPGATTSGTNTSNIFGIISTYYPSPYAYSAGTSMAAPLVAAAAAMVRSANPYLSAAETRQILRETARDLGAPGWDAEYGYGLVDMEAALRRALSEPYGRFSSSSTSQEAGEVTPRVLSADRLAEYARARAEATWDPAGRSRVSVLLRAGSDADAIAALPGVRRVGQTPMPDGILVRLELTGAAAATFETLRTDPAVLLVHQERLVQFSSAHFLQSRAE
jgi:subtilisin family serine protease